MSNAIVLNRIKGELLRALEDKTDNAEFNGKSRKVNELLGWQMFVKYHASETQLVSLYREYRTGESSVAQTAQPASAQLTLF